MNRWIVISLGAAMLCASGCVNRAAQAQAEKTKELLNDPTVKVTLATSKVQTVEETLEITGSLTALQDTQVGSKIGGRLVSVLVSDGTPVVAGQIIARIDTTQAEIEMQQAMAQVRAAQAALQQAIKNASIQPGKSSNAISAAENQLRLAKTNLSKLRAGARTEERTQAEWNVKTAKANLDNAKKELDRAKELFDGGAVPKQRLDAAQVAYDNSLGQYNFALQSLNIIQNGARPEDITAAEQQVHQAEIALADAKNNKLFDATYQDQVNAARANLQAAQQLVALKRQNITDATIVSPIAGKVSGRPAQVGTVVAPGTPVARVVGRSGLYFEGQAPENLLADIRIGSDVKVTVDAVGGQPIIGKVASINPIAKEIGRVYFVRIALDAVPANVEPGMFARGTIVVHSVPNAVMVPGIAILGSQAEKHLFWVEGTKAHKVEVTTGLKSDGWVQVTGVQPGKQIVVKGQESLLEGSTVKIEQPEADKQGDSAKPATGA